MYSMSPVARLESGVYTIEEFVRFTTSDNSGKVLLRSGSPQEEYPNVDIIAF